MKYITPSGVIFPYRDISFLNFLIFTDFPWELTKFPDLQEIHLWKLLDIPDMYDQRECENE